jgi:hypothetical protein
MEKSSVHHKIKILSDQIINAEHHIHLEYHMFNTDEKCVLTELYYI